MSLSKNQMYPWIDVTKNPIRGKCPHFCIYCYVPHSRAKHFYENKPYLVETFFQKGLGSGKTVFVGSCFDIFADEICQYHSAWISSILKHCRKYPDNVYLFQTKNPRPLLHWYNLPAKSIIGTTAETNRSTSEVSEAPNPMERLYYLRNIKWLDRMISIEPIMDFDLDEFLYGIENASPKFVSIGADSKGHNLLEPSKEKVKELIQELQKFTEVKIKNNLSRLMRVSC